MTSDQNNTDSSNQNIPNTDRKEDSLDQKSIKEMILNTISSPETIKALAEVLNGINKPAANTANNMQEDNRLQATKNQDKEAAIKKEIEDNNKQVANWYKVQNEIKSLPYSRENNKISVLETLEGIYKDVEDGSKDLSMKRASSLAKLAVLKTELNMHTDPYIRNHPKFNQIKDLYERSNVEAGIIVAEEMLEDMYTYTTTQMKAKEQTNAETEKAKLNQYNKDEGLCYEIDHKNIPLGDAIKYLLHGANRYNKSYKNLTKDDYLQISRNKNHLYNIYAIKRDTDRKINALEI